MESLEFIWDRQKDEQNQRKHGVSFEEAKTAFYDENARVIYDPEHSMEEDRFVLLGLSSSLRVLVVCHCYREEESRIRIISARKATQGEQNQYKENLP